MERLRVPCRRRGDVGQHGGLAAGGAKALAQQEGDGALAAGEVTLTVEDAQEDVAHGGQGDASATRGRGLVVQTADAVKGAEVY